MKTSALVLLALFSTSAVLARDVLQVGPKGSATIYYIENDNVWMRTCDSHTVVEKQSDCEASSEKALGKLSVVKQNLASRISGVNGTYDFNLKKLKDTEKEIAKIEAFKNKYGKADLSIEDDKTIDVAKYKLLKAQAKASAEDIAKLKDALILSEEVINKIVLKGITVANTSEPSTQFEKAVAHLSSSSLPLLSEDYSIGFEVGKCRFKENAAHRKYVLSVDGKEGVEDSSHTHSECWGKTWANKFLSCIRWQVKRNNCLAEREVVTQQAASINNSGKDVQKDGSSSSKKQKKDQKASKQ